ncbi:hypothetical protein CRENBAI_025500, partial [Crenichthys baileyi]
MNLKRAPLSGAASKTRGWSERRRHGRGVREPADVLWETGFGDSCCTSPGDSVWQMKMRAFLTQPSRRLAGKNPPRQPNHRGGSAPTFLGRGGGRALNPGPECQPGEQRWRTALNPLMLFPLLGADKKNPQ